MKFNITRDIKDNIFSANIKFASFGSDSVQAEQEMKLIDDFGPTRIQIQGIISGEYIDNELKLNDGITITEEAIPIKIYLDYAEADVDSTFDVTYSVDSTKVILTETQKSEFKTKAVYAEKLVELYILTIKDRLEKALNEWRSKYSEFDINNPETFII